MAGGCEPISGAEIPEVVIKNSVVAREYRMAGPLLHAIRSLYTRSESCVHMLGIESDLFSVAAPCLHSCS